MVVSAVVVSAVLSLATGCGSEAVDLQRRAAPVVAGFDRFERWALRTVLAESAFPTDAARRAALFAPLREIPAAKQASVAIGEDAPVVWPVDSVTPSSVAWRPARFGDLGVREIGFSEEVPERVWIARTSRLASIGVVRVVVAFETGPRVQ